ncbi:hypothetical protein EV424DRAFT_1560270, partial [Suillus variegatus]
MSTFVPGHFNDYPPPLGEGPDHPERPLDTRQENFVISEMLQVVVNNSVPDLLDDFLQASGEQPGQPEQPQDLGETNFVIDEMLQVTFNNSALDPLNDTVPALGAESAHPEHTQGPGKMHLSRVQQVVIAAHNNDSQAICATDLTLGLRRIPAGFHAVVEAKGAEYQTSNKSIHIDQAVVKWHERILLLYIFNLYYSCGMAPNQNTTNRGRKYIASTSSNNQVDCQYCNKSYSARGIKSHKQGCLRRRDKKNDDKDFAALAACAVEEELQRKEARREKRRHRKEQTMASAVVAAAAPLVPLRMVPDGTKNSSPEQDQQPDDFTAGPLFEGNSDVADAMSISRDSDARQRSESDTSMGIPACTTLSSLPIMPSAPPNLDTFKTGIPPTQRPLIWRIADGQVKFTFKSHGDVSKAWDRAASQMSPFEKHTITVEHKREDLKYNIYTRPLWDWALDLLQDPLLAPHFVWDAQRLYKHNGMRYERFVHEPWTGDRWWNVQSSLPENGVPFAFILYADKTHLSSAGTVKAYPVFVRCGNLPVNIRNTDGLGGGRMVGWLPIVPDDSEEDGKLSYVNLKRVVWHKAFFKLLETIIIYAKAGCVMALIRGTNCHCPCPICLVPSDKLYDNASTYPTRSSDDTKALVELWTRDRVAGESALKKQGLRPIKDHLHVYHMGQWKHLFGELKQRIAALGRSNEKKLDDQFDTFPRWRNLNHFDRVTNITYSDGNKLRDISRQVLYAAQNILTRAADEAGYALLRCIASYLHIDMYISLDVQTESMIAAGRAEVLEFQKHSE